MLPMMPISNGKETKNSWIERVAENWKFWKEKKGMFGLATLGYGGLVVAKGEEEGRRRLGAVWWWIQSSEKKLNRRDLGGE